MGQAGKQQLSLCLSSFFSFSSFLLGLIHHLDIWSYVSRFLFEKNFTPHVAVWPARSTKVRMARHGRCHRQQDATCPRQPSAAGAPPRHKCPVGIPVPSTPGPKNQKRHEIHFRPLLLWSGGMAAAAVAGHGAPGAARACSRALHAGRSCPARARGCRAAAGVAAARLRLPRAKFC